MYRGLLSLALCIATMAAVSSGVSSQAPAPAARPPGLPAVARVTWAEAQPIVKRLEEALPESLRAIPPADREKRWPAWIDGQRRALESRIAQGDVDSVVNLMLFGTSFTSEPRITARLLADLNQKWAAGDRSMQETLARHYQQRAADLVNAVWAAAGADARLQDVKRVLSARGHSLDTATGQRAAIQDLLASVARVREEAAGLAEELEAQRRAKDSTVSFAERSRAFRTRGLSADSSVLTQFAVDRGVCALGDRGVLTARSVNRIAIVGPGLDFVDKQEGFDFYEPQSLQPFTLADSLLHCGLATRNTLSITTIDISPRVTGHLRAAVRRANERRTAYRLVLAWNPDNVTNEATAYWKRAGAQVGRAFAAPAPHGVPGVLARGVAVAPDIVSRLQPVDASIVSDRLTLPAERHFDLVLASNVLVYYDTFEQTLALASIAAMLKPGGVLLTNDAMLEIPEVPLRSEGSLAVPFSDRPGDGERMVWYVKTSGGR
jgi:SAM-dependent methyltransferase